MEDVLFCSKCFATSKDGSWGSIGFSVDEFKLGSNHCMNCGAGGTCVLMKDYQTENIRESASWVGKRYYPHEEDFWNKLTLTLGNYKTLFIKFKYTKDMMIMPKKFFRFERMKKK